MKQNAEPFDVVAAVIDRDDRYLLAQRAEGKHHGGLWEFPGGKVAPGESHAEAITRELKEELGLTVQSAGRLLGRYTEEALTIHFVAVATSGEPVLLEHADARWCGIEDMLALELCPLDHRFITEKLARKLSQ